MVGSVPLHWIAHGGPGGLVVGVVMSLHLTSLYGRSVDALDLGRGTPTRTVRALRGSKIAATISQTIPPNRPSGRR